VLSVHAFAPEQYEVGPVAVMVGTAGAELTNAVMALEVAGLLETPDRLDVITQVIT
jgi:hypothetical protein